MAAEGNPAKPPPIANVWREFASVPKIMAGRVRPPVCVPGAGGGRPVIVIPGMMSGDGSTTYLRRSLEASGFESYAAAIRFHTGIDDRQFGKLAGRIRSVRNSTGQPPILLGWSLGGMYARALALSNPDDVSMVMTLGSPFSGPRTANRAWRLYNLVNDHTVDDPPIEVDVSRKPPVFTIAAWSQRDGVVSAASSRGLPEEADETLELPGSHIDLGTSSRCVRPIIERLAEAG